MLAGIVRVTAFETADLRAVATGGTAAELKAEVTAAVEAAGLSAVSAEPEASALCQTSNGIVLMPTANLCRTMAIHHQV